MWKSADFALWRTVHMVHDLLNSRVPEYRVETFFPLVPGEVALAGGPIGCEAFRTAGDGSYVHSSGFAFGTGGLFRWGWASIDLMQVVDFNRIVLQGRSDRGLITWRATSELIFALCALNRHPQHPQLLDGTWLPPGWIEWATAMGYRPHLSAPAIRS